MISEVVEGLPVGGNSLRDGIEEDLVVGNSTLEVVGRSLLSNCKSHDDWVGLEHDELDSICIAGAILRVE